MLPAADPGWGYGWPNCTPPSLISVAVCGAGRLTLPVRTEIVPLVAGLVLDLEAARRAEHLGPADGAFRNDWSWGGACRAISGTSSPSNHSGWLAEDLDAPENPYLSAEEHADPHPLRRWIPNPGRYLRTTMPSDTAAIAARWGFRWGGLYTTKPDPMHFELDLTREEVAELIADLRELDGRPTNAQIPREDEMVIVERGSDESRIHIEGEHGWYFAPKFQQAGSRKRRADIVLDDAGWELLKDELGARLHKVA